MTLYGWLFAALLAIGALASRGVAQDAVPRPEHPRPDFQRDDWLSLNGTWQFEMDNEDTGEARGLTSGKDLAQTILVPFCPESKLSGIGHTDFMTRVWYRRHFAVPAGMQGRRLLLHFGAVDWQAQVWLNGKLAGEHKGGYTPFALDVTELVGPGANELVVSARDNTRSGLQAAGKQCFERESFGCVYTRTTGIWQTVWLEAVGEAYLREFAATPDPDTGQVFLQAWVAGPMEGVGVHVEAIADGRVVAETTVPAAGRSTLAALRIPDPKLWAPGHPYLYELRLTVGKGGAVLDRVHSYFGLRQVHTDGRSFLINGKRIFQRLVLDQGFYPDGIYTAPTDEALRHDIELSMAAGFNGARLHQKVFEPRLLYWADKLGYLLWGEYPSWGVGLDNAAAVGQVVLEWQEVLRRDRNHPAIIGWCPLNETGGGEGVALAQALLGVTQLVDPTRPYLDSSGYVHLYPGTDVYDCHDYDQNPESFGARYAMLGLTGQAPWSNAPGDLRSAYRGQPFLVSEYGGTHLAKAEGQGEAWGYGSSAQSIEDFLARYKGLTDVLLDNRNMCGFCYTQLTDIEQEQNGIYFYDRTQKYDPALVKAINERPAAYETLGPRDLDLEMTEVLPTSRETAQTWRYTTEAPPAGWEQPGFDDSAWQEGPGGFGREDTPGAVIRTPWLTDDIWLRRSFDLASTDCEMALLDIHHDEDAEVYLNGRQVAALSQYTSGYVLADRTEALREALKPGRNTIAVHCRQTEGGQFIDVGIRFAKPR